MTPEEFEQLLHRSPTVDFVAALAPLTEPERKALRDVLKATGERVSNEKRAFMEIDGPLSADDFMKRMERSQKRREQWEADNPWVESNVALGVLACGTAADAHRQSLWTVRIGRDELVVQVMLDRNPKWLSSWVTRRLGSDFATISWEQVRGFMAAGAIEKPTSEGYTQLFVEAMRGYDRLHPDTYVRTSDRLLADPELLEDELWRLFEGENHAFTRDWNAKAQNAPENYETWPEAIARLAAEGHIDRDRVLDSSLNGTTTEIKQNQLSAFAKLHEALKPSSDELQVRQDRYLDLLVSPTGSVVAFALKMLTKLHRAGQLDAERFLDSARAVFALKTKGTAMQTLRLAKKLAASDEALGANAGSLAIAAMAHASPDVQGLAVDIVETTMAASDDGDRHQFEAQIQFLAPNLQKRARALLGETAPDDETQDPPPDMSELAGEITALPDRIRRIARLDDIDPAAMPPALDYDILDMPAVAHREPVTRIEKPEELLEAAAHLIESVDSAHQVETLIDGIARLGTDRSGNFEKLAAPLVQRLEKGQTSSYGLGSGWTGASVAIIDLLMTWFTGQYYDSTRTPHFYTTPREAFAAQRIREAQKQLLDKKPAPLVSLPTYRTGWIVPGDLVERVRQFEESGWQLRASDVMQALLRLAPGGRAKALEAAGNLKGDVGRLLRFALGGDERPKRKDRSQAHLWVCAGRARLPAGSLRKALGPVASKVPDLPELVEPADWSWSVKINKQDNYRTARIDLEGGHLIDVDLDSKLHKDWWAEIRKKMDSFDWHLWPLAGTIARSSRWWFSTSGMHAPWQVEWLAMQQPLQIEGYFGAAVRMLDMRSDMDTSRDEPYHTHLEALFDPTRRWGEMAVLTACLGLISRSGDTRGFAVDAVVPAIESGHADARVMGRTFAALFEDDAYKLNRFGPVMENIHVVSPLHQWWVARLVDHTVTAMNSRPRGSHYLYGVALDCLAALNMRPTDEMAEILKAHSGSSKTARLARDMLSLEGPPVDQPSPAVTSLAVQGRLDFARSLVD